MSDTKHAEVTLVVHLPYAEHDEETLHNIKLRADRIQEDKTFIASWYGVEVDQLTDNEERYVEATVNLRA